MLVVVGIPSCKRPNGLARLLDSIAKQQVDFDVCVLVADNDAEGQEGIETVARYQRDGFPFPLEAFVVAERGISQTRNALMQRAFTELQADSLAMLDDDEWAEEQWLRALVLVQTLTNADVVGGHVLPDFEVPPPDWVEGLSVYPRKKRQQSGNINFVYGTTNVLLHKSILTQCPGQYFDPFYSLVGRGDVEFFVRLKNHGATFAIAHRARSHEIFGPSRLTKHWARERAFCDGAGHMRIVLKNRTGLKRFAMELTTVAVASVVGCLKVLVNVTQSHRRMAGQLLFMRQMGKISALFGRHREVYRQIHGR